ncbi:LacI family DNA-binding transcriptional regulator [Microvirga sp. 2MCAF38]|uniref:LacI family DNA-binding transcriptional regulator n=1 Tax=Microvirga sp. 2MCAF38 TaxID=3232989 RepID=UPI003F949715
MAASNRDERSKPERAARGFVTSADVARLAGVSRSAVSRTFTPGASVSTDVRERVQEAAKALGYRVNRLARSLISEQSNLVGVVGSNLSTPFMARQLDQLSLALLKRSMQCLLLNAAEAEQGISSLIELILEFRVRAIVILSGAPPSAIIDECLANGVRVILVNRKADDAATDTIISDDIRGTELVAERFLRAGCKRVGVVSSGAGTPSQTRRRERFLSFMAEAGLITVQWAKGDTTYDTGVLAARELLAQNKLDGVFCVTDLIALGFLDGARELGRKVPEDLSVIGFDDIPQSSWSPYRLTTIRQSLSDLTESVVAAIERESDEGAPIIHRILPVELVERDTTP